MIRRVARNPLVFLALLGLILVGLSLTAGGCDAEAGGVKATVKGYYDAVARGDREGQAALWLPDRQGEAAVEAQAWGLRDKAGSKLAEVHISDGPAGDQRLVHATLSLEDSAQAGQRRYESQTLLLQRLEREWRIRDAR